MNQPKPFPRRGWRLVLAGVLLAAWLGFWHHARRDSLRGSLPDEKSVALNLLAGKFTGPGYFHGELPGTNRTPGTTNTDFKISVSAACSQISRILTERGMAPDAAAGLETMIDLAAEPPESRMVGVPEVNLLRLNLALDAMDSKP